MLDFIEIGEKIYKDRTKEIFPKFIINANTKDLMIKGRDFYAVWDEQAGEWSTNEQTLIDIVDGYLWAEFEKQKKEYPFPIVVRLMRESDSGSIDKWHKYCQKQMRDSYQVLDQKIIFADTVTTKLDYASHRLPFKMEAGDISNYERCMNTWYDLPERTKIEWFIGGVISGDIEKIEKFAVLYGSPGSGKGSFIKFVLLPIFEGYWAPFDEKSLTSNSGQFWGESFKDSPLISVQTDGKLSRIEDNSRLNAIVSHETVEINEKFKSKYRLKLRTILFMCTNEPVRISDAKSGLTRRLVDIYPSGRKLTEEEYFDITPKIKFELGAIAHHCLGIFKKLGPYYYNDYVATGMLAETNDFYNYIEYNYDHFKEKDYVSATEAWRRWQEYKAFADIDYHLTYKRFCSELRNYFREFKDDWRDEVGKHIRSVYFGFISEKFKAKVRVEKFIEQASKKWIVLREQHSLLDDILADCPAQYIADDGKRAQVAWKWCKTVLRDIDTRRLHYVRAPLNHIVIDFDIYNEKGEKDRALCLEEANKWPHTYVELSKGGGVHLHYIYTGDPLLLANCMPDNPHIEIKLCKGLGAIRRKLTECNDIPIAKISSGLPLKELKGGTKEKVGFELYSNETALRSAIQGHIDNWVNGVAHTTPTINLIADLVNKAYEKEFPYDISDLYGTLIDIARQSTNNSDSCEAVVNKLYFKSKDVANKTLEEFKYYGKTKDDKLVFFDIEQYPNFLLICWKYEFSNTVQSMRNPTPEEVEDFINTFKLIGFNNLKYDNYILHARRCGDSIYDCYLLSKRIISGDRNAGSYLSRDISYCDVYDMASAANKMSLKKYEILLGRLERKAKKWFEAGFGIDDVADKLKVSKILVKTWYDRKDRPAISHMEIGFDWNEPVPEEYWDQIEEYCKNDVLATEDVFHYLEGDYKARCMLSALSVVLSPNATTNSQTTQIIFEGNKEPQSSFIYTDLSTLFPGYVFANGKSLYRGEDPGEGGYVFAKPGIYYDVAVLDVASMHPSSIEALNMFGDYYTKRFSDIKRARIYIKHKEYDKARTMLDGKLAPYLDNPADAKAVADALKTAINSVYGLTSAGFKNPFKDPRNVDNIVAKRGALFMIDLRHEVEDRGYTVVHIKTDSIKIANADNDIIKFVMDYGKKWGYTFEHESTYDRICLVNDAVYIAKYADSDWCEKRYSYIPGNNVKDGGAWTATGAQFQVPYIFKKLFTKEPVEFDDLCEIKSVSTALYLDMNEGYPDVTQWEKLKELRNKTKSAIVGIRDKFTLKEKKFMEDNSSVSDEELEKLISVGHNYQFVGRVGEFVPIKPGCDGGILVRKSDDGYSSANGAKGYRWLESETVRLLGRDDIVDFTYHDEMCKKAIETIEKYGSFNRFVAGIREVISSPLPDFMNIPEGVGDEVPFDGGYVVNQ